MSNLSQEKRERMLNFLETIKKEKKDDEWLIAINEIENELNSKKYGLIWEKHEEAVDAKMLTHVPVFSEVKEKIISENLEDDSCNFLLEGDNLHSLKLLEKTHKGKIDLIYIDPPYNTGNSFIYDDKIVSDEDDFKHSKWASFMYCRLKIAKSLLSKDGLCFISIDDKEQSVLRMMCDEIFGEGRFLTTIAWEKRTKCQNTKTARKMLQPRIEYILVYKNTDARIEFECHIIGEREYPENDNKGAYRNEEVGQMSANGVRGRGSMVFPILDIYPREGNQWKIGIDTVEEFIERGDLYKQNNKIYRKIRPEDESSEEIKPFWAFFSAEQFGTAESAKKQLSKILGYKDHEFETVKPVQMIEEIIYQATKEDSIVLDFFAGSGTTAQAVLETNKDYGGNRKFILCTNNENDICEKITFQRLKTVIRGKRDDGSEYSKGLPTNLKYFKTDYISKTSNDEYYSVEEELTKHIEEMIELENGISIDNEKFIMILSDEDMDVLEKEPMKLKKCKTVYISGEVLLTQKQEALLNGVETIVIPKYYFEDELMEVGEL